MPSQINNPGNIGYGTGGDVSANYLKAKPSTRFSTRQLAFIDIGITDVQVGYEYTDSAYSRAIRGVQTVAEIYAVGVPAGDHFMVVIAQDTDAANDNNDLPDNDVSDSQNMATAITRSLGAASGAFNGVSYKHMEGNGFANGVMMYGDTKDTDGFFGDESVLGNNYPD